MPKWSITHSSSIHEVEVCKDLIDAMVLPADKEELVEKRRMDPFDTTFVLRMDIMSSTSWLRLVLDILTCMGT